MIQRSIVTLFFFVAVFAGPVYTQSLTTGVCPPVFELHSVDHNGEDHPEHRIVGRHVDRNEDQQLCVNHATPSGNIHIHIDNLLPLP